MNIVLRTKCVKNYFEQLLLHTFCPQIIFIFPSPIGITEISEKKNSLTPLSYQRPEYFWWVIFIVVLSHITENKSKIRGGIPLFFFSFLIWSIFFWNILYFFKFFLYILYNFFSGNQELQNDKSQASDIDKSNQPFHPYFLNRSKLVIGC